MYGLPKVESSDKDYYAIGTYKDLGGEARLYPRKRWNQKKRTKAWDVEYIELCAFFTYLMNGHIFYVESLFVPKNAVHIKNDKFERLVLDNVPKLIDRNQVLDNIFENAEHIQARNLEWVELLRSKILPTNPEKKIIAGIERMHQEFIRKGFFHRDYLHAIRVASSSISLMKDGVYGTQLADFDPEAFEFCSRLKQRPEDFEKKDVDQFLESRLDILKKFDFILDDQFEFNTSYVQSVIKEFYP